MSKFGFGDYGELEYNREGKTFTDCWYTTEADISKMLQAYVTLVIECKYKSDGQYWLYGIPR